MSLFARLLISGICAYGALFLTHELRLGGDSEAMAALLMGSLAFVVLTQRARRIGEATPAAAPPAQGKPPERAELERRVAKLEEALTHTQLRLSALEARVAPMAQVRPAVRYESAAEAPPNFVPRRPEPLPQAERPAPAEQPVVYGEQPVVYGEQPVVYGEQPVVYGDQPELYAQQAPEALSLPTGPPSSLESAAAAPQATGQRAAPWWQFFTGENAAVRLGVLVLLLGLGFLLAYAAEQGAFPPAARLMASVGVGAVLSALGLWLRSRRRLYGLALLGGGFATLFLCIFASYAVLDMVTPATGRYLLVGLSATLLLSALVIGEESMAILAVIGALGAPFMASTGGGFERLLAYDALIAAVTVTIALRWDFGRLARVAATLTFAGLAIAAELTLPAGYTSSGPAPTLALAAIAVCYTAFPAVSAFLGRGGATATLVFGAPLAAQGVALLFYGASWESPAFLFGTGLSALCGAFALLLWRRAPVVARSELLAAAGLLALVMRYYLGDSATLVAWSIEAVGLAYLGVHGGDGRLVLSALALVWLVVGVTASTAGVPGAHPPYWNAAFLAQFAAGAALLAVGALIHRRPSVSFAPLLAHVAAAAGVAAVGWAVVAQSTNRPEPAQLAVAVAAGAALAVLSEALGSAVRTLPELNAQRPRLASLRALASALPLVTAPLSTALQGAPTLTTGYVVGALALVVLASMWVLPRHDATRPLARWARAGLLWTAAATAALALQWALPTHQDLARALGVLAMAGVVVLAQQDALAGRLALPARGHALPSFAQLTLALLVLAFDSSGRTAPVPYVPVVGLVDLALIAGVVALFVVTRGNRGEAPSEGKLQLRVGAAVLALLLMATVLARAVAYYGGERFSLDLLSSAAYQASLSLTYGLTGLVVMMAATRRLSRAAYLFGAGLLGLIVVKLMLVDLAGSGTLGRIVTFIGVGVILLVVGYFVPIPPAESSKPAGNPGPGDTD